MLPANTRIVPLGLHGLLDIGPIWIDTKWLHSIQTRPLKLAPLGILMGAYGTPAYLSLTYLMNSKTRT